MEERASVIALLGPTNTGKTHRAIERMLDFDSGMMGFPLRLLAREVYDKLSVRVGESQVALVTGEEKRIPARPRYWIATIEAMPLDQSVEFLAVDEIQLAAHRERGHVFTRCLLHARGTRETWLLGADTMREALVELVPGVEIRSSPRLSTLSWAGVKPLSQLPKRSALVSFSIPRVLALGEMLRERKGGAAVVLGALSPRARNAQVAMFQAGEVDYLVATDAIGMGLNLDLAHVAFASLVKFDGRETRALELAEVAQIAGRAGRHTQNGTFGIAAPLGSAFASPSGRDPSFSSRSISALERHRFPPVGSLRYRSADVDLSSIEALLASLEAPPPHPLLRRTDDAADHAVLRAFAERADIVKLSRAKGGTALLYDVAGVPDYRKILFEDHVEVLSDIYRRLMERNGRLEEPFVSEKLERLEAKSDRDLEDLLARLAASRIWNYVAQQRWVDHAGQVQAHAMRVEDSLSDALHKALCDRFVAARKRWTRSETKALGGPFAALLDRFGAAAAEPSKTFAERLDSVEHSDLAADASGAISFEGQIVAKLTGGKDVRTPSVKLLVEVSPSERLRAERRLTAFARDLVRTVTLDLLPDETCLSAAGRGLAYVLGLGLSTACIDDVQDLMTHLEPDDWRAFRRAGFVFGHLTIHHPRALKPDAVRLRASFVAPFDPTISVVPSGKEISVRVRRDAIPASYAALGYPLVGGHAIRADILERVARRLSEAPREDWSRMPVASWLGIPSRETQHLMSHFEGRVGAPRDPHLQLNVTVGQTPD